MAAVTQRVPSYLGGVSKQTDIKKLPGQVRECLNAYPDPTFGLMKRPGTKHIKEIATTTLADAKWFYIHRDGEEQYIGCITKGDPGDIKIWNAIDGTACTVTYPTGSHQNYLKVPSTNPATPDTPNTNYDLLTIQATTIVTNKKTVVTSQAASAHTANKKATIRIHKVAYKASYQIKIGSDTTATYVTRDNDDTATTALSADEILTQLETNIVALSGWDSTNVKRLPGSIELSGSSAITLELPSGVSNENLSFFHEQVNSISDLPSQSATLSSTERYVKIINTISADTSYWVKFVPASGTSGPGYWQECKDPTASPGLTNSTMPHELVNTALNTFQFKEISWGQRVVGNETTNENPTFVGTEIQQCFLYNNRLGFLTGDNVSMSKAGGDANFYDFFMTSTLTTTAADPIGLNCSSIRPAVLHGIIPTAQGLVLFSKNQQFIMFSTSGVLTPATSLIRTISNYEMDNNIDPVDVGTTISFVSKTPSYSRLFGMQTRGYEESPIIQDISRAVSEWIPETVDSLIASPQNSITAVYGRTDDLIYLYRVYGTGGDEMMQSWFKWKMPGNVQFCNIDNDVMYTIIENGTTYNLLKSSISKSTSEDILETADGTKINPHIDMLQYPSAAAKVTLVNSDKDTKIELPYKHITGLKPVVILKGSVDTEAGFVVSATASEDSGTWYFTVSDTDLKTNTTYSDIAFGYQYNYDIELPKSYYKIQSDPEKSDYAANLTIARMKFAVGLSSTISFKLKSKGYRGPIAEFTGDGSTTAFIVPFPLKEENGITVKLDGRKQTSGYTVTTTETQATVTFSSAPTAASTAANVTTPAQKIEITTDTWYDVQPVQDANEYLADDVPLVDENTFTVPIHQRTDNFDLRVFSDSPFPLALNSMMWEGQYSPRYYRRN